MTTIANSNKKESDLDLETETENIENFKEILPFFFLDNESHKRVIDTLAHETRRLIDNWLDKFLELDKVTRRRIIEVEKNEKTDEAYKLYLGNLDKKILASLDDNLIRETTKYENFLSGRITINKQEGKLFKFCLKKRILHQKDIDNINLVKSKSNGLMVAVSRNPIDYLFCSTGNFSSCLSLIPNCEGMYYLGLGSLSLDPNRYIVYHFKGIKTYTIKGYKFTIPNIVSRSWVLINQNNVSFMCGYYPHRTILLANVLNKIGIETRKPYTNAEFGESKFEFDIPRYNSKLNNQPATIYYDNYGLEIDEYGTARYSEKTRTGAITSFDTRVSFENLNSEKDILYCSYECSICGEYVSEEEVYYIEHEEAEVCRDCFNTHYFICQYCENIFRNEEAIEIEDKQDEWFCISCANEIAAECQKCNRLYSLENIYSVDTDFYCMDCIDDVAESCSSCGEWFYLEDIVYIKGEPYCKECAKEAKAA